MTVVQAPKSGKKRSRAKWTALWWLVLIAVGFAAGNRTTFAAQRGPSLVRRLFGLPADTHVPATAIAPPQPQQPATPPVSMAPPAQSPQANPGASGPLVRKGTAAASPPVDSAAPAGASTTDTSAPPDTAETGEEFEQQIRTYNSDLRDVQRQAAAIKGATTAASRSNAAAVYTSSVQHALALYDVIVSNSRYSGNYSEAEPALAQDQAPAGFPDLPVWTLHFIRPVHH